MTRASVSDAMDHSLQIIVNTSSLLILRCYICLLFYRRLTAEIVMYVRSSRITCSFTSQVIYIELIGRNKASLMSEKTLLLQISPKSEDDIHCGHEYAIQSIQDHVGTNLPCYMYFIHGRKFQCFMILVCHP